jgi:hypothetical protein
MMKQGRFDESGNTEITQEAITEASVQVFLQLPALFAQGDALRSGARSIAP